MNRQSPKPAAARTDIVSARVLAAGNIYCRHPVVRLRLADSAVADLPADAGQRLAEAAAPPARWHADLPDFPAWQRLSAEDETLPATLAIEILALLLQRWAFWPPRFARRGARPGARGPHDRLRDAPAGSRPDRRRDGRQALQRPAARAARPRAVVRRGRNLHAQDRPRHADIRHAGDRAQRRTATGCRGRWCQARHVRLGSGRYGKLVHGADADGTSAVGMRAAKRKPVANAIFAQAHLPVAVQRTARTPEQAIEAARWIGFPVVVKPAEGRMSRCVTVGVRDEAGVVEAFAHAQTISAEGRDRILHRGRVVPTARRRQTVLRCLPTPSGAGHRRRPGDRSRTRRAREPAPRAPGGPHRPAQPDPIGQGGAGLPDGPRH